MQRSFEILSNHQDGQNDTPGPDRGTTVLETKPRLKKPSMYKVLMHNDDYTTQEFVVHVLKHFFSLSESAAVRVMLQVHQEGVGVCGVYTLEIAETKVSQVIDYARKNEHPLQCTLEKA